MYADNLNTIASQHRNALVEAALACSAETMAGVEKMIELNVQTVRTSLSEQQALADAALSVHSVTEAIDLQSQQLPATITKTFAYWRHMEDIATQTRLGVFSAIQERFGDSLRAWAGLVDATAGSTAGQVAAATDSMLVTGEEAAAQPAAAVAIVDSAGHAVTSPASPANGGELH
jgi:phasin family protein